MRLFASFIVVSVVMAVSAHAQIAVNNGTIVHAKSGAIVYVRGGLETRAGSVTEFDGASELTVTRDIQQIGGQIFFLGPATGYVYGNCVIGSPAALFRRGSGLLSVRFRLNNAGLFENDGVVEIGQP